MSKSFPRYWLLNGQRVMPCTRLEWHEFRKNARGFVLAKTFVEPGFMIQTQFVGFQRDSSQAPDLFRTSVFSDLGESRRQVRTWSDARRMHQMEVQRIESIVARNHWQILAEAKDGL